MGEGADADETQWWYLFRNTGGTIALMGSDFCTHTYCRESSKDGRERHPLIKCTKQWLDLYRRECEKLNSTPFPWWHH